MSSQQKRGFRLPWALEHDIDAGAAGAATLDPAGSEGTISGDRDDLGEGLRLTDGSPLSTEDAAPAASALPRPTAEAAMIEMQTDPNAPGPATVASSPAGGEPADGAAWPDVDRQDSEAHARDDELAAARPAIRVARSNGPGRRDNPLVAGLVKAMREAAVASRDETLARLKIEAEARVEEIRALATTEAAELQKRAETDISVIREWSKAEIARVRAETEERIEARRAGLASETERHGETIERLVGDVHTVVAAFEADMDRFFEVVLAEKDPARLAALFEQAPDAPDLSTDGARAIDLVDEAAAAPEPAAQEDSLRPSPLEHRAPVEPASDSEALGANDAAAAEVAAAEGLDIGAAEWPAAVLAPARRREAGAEVPSATLAAATRLHVSGLSSVAGISALKGRLGQLPGVSGISVSSGERGVFIFAVSHEPGTDIAGRIAKLTEFEAQITGVTDDGLSVAAREPA